MADISQIEWTDATWNPWQGCHKVSPGCKNCYMYRDKERYGQDPSTVVRSKGVFRAPLKWADKRMVFTCSWSDFFIEEADAWRDEAWAIIKATPHLTYQILTKRPENIADRLPADWGPGYDNVWLGTSIETNKYVGRADALRLIPATLRFLSLEPLLGPLPDLNLRGIGWVIVGGESGSSPRFFGLDCLEDIYAACSMNLIPLFVKQDSGKLPGMKGRIPDRLWIKEIPR